MQSTEKNKEPETLRLEIHEPFRGTAECDDPRKIIVPLTLVQRDPENARLHPERNIRGLRASLRRRGQQTPIVVDRDGVIAKGNGTHEAAEAEAWTHIWIVATSLTGEEIRAYGISDNATGLSSKWDFEQLGRHVSDLKEFDGTDLEFSNDDLGFEEHEISPMLAADWQPPSIDNEGGTMGGTTALSSSANNSSPEASGNQQPVISQPDKRPARDPHIDLEEADRASDELAIAMTPNMRITVDQAIERVRLISGDFSISQGRCIELICADYLAGAPLPHELEQDESYVTSDK